MVVWSVLAKNDLKNIHDFIANDSKFYAIKVSHEFIEKSELLEQFPKMGRSVPEIGDENVRELLLYSYRLIYEVSSKETVILTIVHVKQDFSSAYKKHKK